MALDMFVSWLINKASNRLSRSFMAAIMRIMRRPLRRLAHWLARRYLPRIIASALTAFMNVLFGGPTGGSSPRGPFDRISTWYEQRFDRWFRPLFGGRDFS
jgi:hypothetical protein